MSKLVLIDGNAILHRAYHALPPTLTTKKGGPINAVYGFTSMLLKIIQDLEPTHIAVAFDRKEPTFRHVAFEEYQAHRPEMDKELSSQFGKAKKVAQAMGIPIYEKAGYEADDVIGTIAKKSEKKRDSVVIVTGDRDILQLVTDKTKVYLPIKGLSNARLFGIKEVIEKLGVKPSQVVDYKALVGDPSDNYPGVSGIGPKTAEKLLGKYKDFKGVYKNLDKISNTVSKKLKEGKKSGEISYKLARIVTDAPVEFEKDKMDDWQVDSPEVLDLFAEFGFKTLTKRVKSVGKELKEESQLNLI
jgi:DNA polymerase-1